MSRTHFWTILIGTDPTSFRARDRDTLVPTLKQLQRRHPEAVIKWFEGDKLWETPLEAAEARDRAEREKRPKGWRPGGDHRDPRAKYDITRDEKRRRFKMRQHQAPRGERQGPPGAPPDRRPEGGGAPPRRPDRFDPERREPASRDARGPAGRPPSDRERGPQGSPGDRPQRFDRPRAPRGAGDRPSSDRPRTSPRPPAAGGSPFRPKSNQRPTSHRPPGSGAGDAGARGRPPRPRGPKKPREE